jgi:hypothetical protein
LNKDFIKDVVTVLDNGILSPVLTEEQTADLALWRFIRPVKLVISDVLLWDCSEEGSLAQDVGMYFICQTACCIPAWKTMQQRKPASKPVGF